LSSKLLSLNPELILPYSIDKLFVSLLHGVFNFLELLTHLSNGRRGLLAFSLRLKVIRSCLLGSFEAFNQCGFLQI
jgi:hypothetical protein